MYIASSCFNRKNVYLSLALSIRERFNRENNKSGLSCVYSYSSCFNRKKVYLSLALSIRESFYRARGGGGGGRGGGGRGGGRGGGGRGGINLDCHVYIATVLALTGKRYT